MRTRRRATSAQSRGRPRLALLAAGLAAAACGGARPDVVLISVDTLRRDHLPLYGYAAATAPRLGALGREALVFEDAVAAHTNTGPSHASMLTGLYPPQHGILRNRYRLRAGVRTLAEELRGRGYETAAFVSGYTLKDELTGLGRGFAHYDDGGREARERGARHTLRRARRWLEERPAGVPLFLFFHLFDPHFPYRPPPEHAARLLAAGPAPARPPDRLDLQRVREGGARPGELGVWIGHYDGEIAYADEQVGRLLDLLRARGRYERSLVIFTSDHGETLGERAHPFDHGARAYEEQVRVPLVIRLPGGAGGGRRVEGPAHHVDLAPTVLDLLGLPPWPVPGRSLRPLWERGTAPREAALVFARPEAKRVPEVDAELRETGLVAALRRPPHKLIAYPAPGGGWRYQLFDLARDPGERRDLAGERPERVRELAAELEARLAPLGALDAAPPEIDPEDLEALRSLGYVE